MLTINRIDHIGVAVTELGPQIDMLEGLFGFAPQLEWENPDEGYRAVMLQIPGNSGVRWEVRAPLDDTSKLNKFLDSPRGPGMHHVSIEVPDVEKARQELKQLGVDTQPGPSDGEIQIHPEKDGNGFLFHFFSPGGEPKGTPASNGAPSTDTLGIVGIDHVCHGFRDRDELRGWYEKVFGMRQIFRTPDGEHPDMADLVLKVPGDQMLWEIIQPVGDDSFIQKFLDTRGPAIHHVTFEVGDWDKALEACKRHNARILDIQEGETDGAQWRDTFLHPKFTGGVLVQLFWEEKPGVWIKSDKIAT